MAALTTESGKKVPELVPDPTLFIDKTTVLYGPSKTGKTVIVKAIMKQVRPHIEQVLVVAPTEVSNRAYDGFVDPSLIHHRMYLADPKEKRDTDQKAALRFLEMVYQRQEMMAAAYMRANNPIVLAALYARVKGAARKKNDDFLSSLARKRRRVIEVIERDYAGEHGRRDAQIKEAHEKFEKMLVLLYKKFLTPEVARLWEIPDLSDDERWALQYMHFNPRLLLIFDDCAAQLKPFFTREVFRKLFYQNRHSFISVIICCQDDTDLPANLRKNAFISIFTEPIVCSSNFERASNGFPKTTRAYVSEIAREVFVGHRKLAYIREDERRQHFYHLTCAMPTAFFFGSPALAELCQAVKADKVSMDKGNPFFGRFSL